MIRLRPGRAEDAEALASLYLASVHQLAAGHYDAAQREAWASSVRDLAAWRERLATLHVLVAECRGETAGFIACDGEGYIDLLFTAPAHARRGVATALFLAASQQLHEQGRYRLRTHASLAARAFFERQGFRVVATETVGRAGSELKRFEMERAPTAG
jgi:putative acetyltransferase